MAHKSKQNAFTLIEVLIAMVILAIALVAVIKIVGDNARGLIGIQDRTIAHWIAIDTIKQQELGIIPIPTDEAAEDSVTMVNKEWYLALASLPTNNMNIQQLKVEVRLNKNDNPLATAYGFIYKISNDRDQ